MESTPKGILYIATGESHCQEAVANALASRLHASMCPIVLITKLCRRRREVSGAFDRVLSHPDPRQGYRDKISGMLQLPFAQTLFLDSDARLTAPVEALFAAQGCADLAAVQAPVRLPRWLAGSGGAGLVFRDQFRCVVVEALPQAACFGAPMVELVRPAAGVQRAGLGSGLSALGAVVVYAKQAISFNAASS